MDEERPRSRSLPETSLRHASIISLLLFAGFLARVGFVVNWLVIATLLGLFLMTWGVMYLAYWLQRRLKESSR